MIRSMMAAALCVWSGAAVAQSCTPPTVGDFNILLSNDGTTASVIFDDFIANPNDPNIPTPPTVATSCDFTVPFANTDYRVYQADILGFAGLDAGQTLTLQETAPGSGTFIVVSGPTLDIYTLDDIALYGVGPNQQLDLAYLLTVEAGAGPAAVGQVDALDLLQIASVSQEALNASLDDVARQRAATIVHLSASAGLLLGSLDFADGGDEFSPVVAAGSYLFGGKGRFNIVDGFSLIGGAAFFEQSVGARAQGLLVAAGLRYISPDTSSVRWLGEAGIYGSPNLTLGFTRNYANGGGPGTTASTVTALSTATGSYFTVYAKGGAVFTLDDANEIVVSASVAQGWLQTSAFGEIGGASNLFAASFAANSSAPIVAKLGAQWTAKLDDKFNVSLLAAVGQASNFSPMAANVAFAGAQTGSFAGSPFLEFGARAGYDINETFGVNAFVLGTTGPQIGTHVQFGGSLTAKF